jgi:hypothetical protein
VLWVNNDVLSLFEVAYSHGGNYRHTAARAALPESVCPILTGSSTVNIGGYQGAVGLQSPQSIPILTAGGTSIWSLVQYGKGWLTDKKPVDVTRYDSARFWLNFRLFCMGEPIPGASTQVMDLRSAVSAAPRAPVTPLPPGGAGYGDEEWGGIGISPAVPAAPEPTVAATAEELDKAIGNMGEEKVIWVQLEREQITDQQADHLAKWVDSGGVLWTDTDLAQSEFGFRVRRADENLVRNSAYTWRTQPMHPVVEGLSDPVEYVLGGSRLLISVEIDRRRQPRGVKPLLGWPPQSRSSSYINAVCAMKNVGRGIVIYRPRDVGGASQRERFEANLRNFSHQSSSPTWSPPESDDDSQTWVDDSGTHRIEAEFVKLEDGKVHLKKTDGTVIQVPLEKLSAEDQAHAKQLAE